MSQTTPTLVDTSYLRFVEARRAIGDERTQFEYALEQYRSAYTQHLQAELSKVNKDREYLLSVLSAVKDNDDRGLLYNGSGTDPIKTLVDATLKYFEIIDNASN